jgi:hypothetical protein
MLKKAQLPIVLGIAEGCTQSPHFNELFKSFKQFKSLKPNPVLACQTFLNNLESTFVNTMDLS